MVSFTDPNLEAVQERCKQNDVGNHSFNQEAPMRKFSICILAVAGVAAASTAHAANIMSSQSQRLSDPSSIEQVRLICDDSGRCYRTRGGRRVIVNSYNYAPRERYYERRRYRHYDEPRAGVGIDAPGVSVGVGVGGGRW